MRVGVVPHQLWTCDVLGGTYLSLHLPDCFCRAGLAQVWSWAGGSQWHSLQLRLEEEVGFWSPWGFCGWGGGEVCSGTSFHGGAGWL